MQAGKIGKIQEMRCIVVLQPTLGHVFLPCDSRRPQFQLETEICKKLYHRGSKVLKVYAYEVSPHGGYSVDPYFCAVVVISRKKAKIAEITTCGNIGKFYPIACNGSVSKKSMHDALGFDAGVRIFAKEFYYHAK